MKTIYIYHHIHIWLNFKTESFNLINFQNKGFHNVKGTFLLFVSRDDLNRN